MINWNLAILLLFFCLKVEARIDEVFTCGNISSFDKSRGIAVMNGQDIRLLEKEGRTQDIATGKTCVSGIPIVSPVHLQVPLLASEIQLRNSTSPKHLKKRFAQFRNILGRR